MKKIVILILSVLPLTATQAQQTSSERQLLIRDLALTMQENTVELEFLLNIGPEAVTGCSILQVFLVMTGSGQRLELPAVVIRSEWAQRKYDRHGTDRAVSRQTISDGYADARNGDEIRYRIRVPYRSWMEKCDLSLEGILLTPGYAGRRALGTLATDLPIREEIRLVYPD